MNFNGYDVEQRHNYIIIKNLSSFNLKDIFECGQAFRWRKNLDNTYTLIAKDRVIKLKHENDKLKIFNSNIEDFKNIWYEYFDLETSYEDIKSKLKKDDIMAKALKHGEGIRILNQDFWEMIISFIISANNRIPMIMKVINEISKKFGEKIMFDEEVFYTFPTTEKLSNAKLEDFKLCKAGYRSSYILDTAKKINEGFLRKEDLVRLSTKDAQKSLKRLMGVGPKVADCILLFSGIKKNIFPTDVWIKRIVEVLYFEREASLKEINNFAEEYYGDISGLAQQYLFYYARENKII
ncbi:MAG: DNA glycosylase [Clostridiales bacterium]